MSELEKRIERIFLRWHIRSRPYSGFIKEMDALIQHEVEKARVEEIELAKYVFQNQVSDNYAIYAAVAGVEANLRDGIMVEVDGIRGAAPSVDGKSFKLPQFFDQRINQIKEGK